MTSFDYEIVKQYSLSKAYLLSFNSIEDADRAIDVLNANADIKYATPSYIISMD